MQQENDETSTQAEAAAAPPATAKGKKAKEESTTQPSRSVTDQKKKQPVVGQAVLFFDKRWKGGVPASVKVVEADGSLTLLVTHPDKSTAQRNGIQERSPEMRASNTGNNVWDWPA